MFDHSKQEWLPMPVAKAQSFATKASPAHFYSWQNAGTLVMDSIASESAVRVTPDLALPDCERMLNSLNARYAFVLNSQQELEGILPRDHLHGQKAISMTNRLNVSYAELSAEDVMVSAAKVPVITRDQLLHSRIGDLVATLQRSESDFLLVSDFERVIGAISGLTIVAKTGESVQIAHHARSFSEIVYALAHSDNID